MHRLGLIGRRLLRLAVALTLVFLGEMEPAAAQPTTIEYQLNGGAWVSNGATATFLATGMPYTLTLRVLAPGHNVEYSLSDGPWVSNGAPATMNFTASPQAFSLRVRIPGHHVEYQVFGPWAGWSYVRSDGAAAESAIANLPHSVSVRIAVPPAADTTPPVTSHTFTGTTGAGGVFLGPVSVTLASSDDRTGVRKTFYRVDGGAFDTYTGAFSVATSGAHTVDYYSEDDAGNVETVRSATLQVQLGTQVFRVPEDHATIQAAIEAAFAAGGGEVVVGPGTYNQRPTLRPGVTLRSADGPATTIISGGGGSPVVTMADDSTLTGFTVQGAGGWNGIAVYSPSGSPTISGNIIAGNGGDGDPSGVNCESGFPLIIGNVIRNGFIGLMVGGCSPTLVNNVIAFNSRWGVYARSGSQARVINNVFHNNNIGGFFGTVNSNIFARNNIFSGTGRLASCTTSVNPPAVMDIDYSVRSGVLDPSGCALGPNTIAASPQFVNAAARDFRLLPTSPAVDAGRDDVAELPAMDFDGNERSWDGDGDGTARVDIGAFELGAPPCVDEDADGQCDEEDICSATPECAAPGVDGVYFATVTDTSGTAVGSIRCVLTGGTLDCDKDPVTGVLVVTPILWCAVEP